MGRTELDEGVGQFVKLPQLTPTVGSASTDCSQGGGEAGTGAPLTLKEAIAQIKRLKIECKRKQKVCEKFFGFSSLEEVLP